MPLSQYLNNSQKQAPANAAGASSAYNPFKKLVEDNFLINKHVQSEALSFINSETGISNKPLNMDYTKYAPYDVYINDIDTEEKLNRERAENQSNFEQTLRMLGQIGNEVVLGTAIGIADLADVIYQAATGELGNTDYQNDVINSLDEFKKSIDERLAIYRENPNAAWDITDFAWWASNVPSIASTVSLMVPGVGVGKAVSFAGKGAAKLMLKNRALTKKVLKARNAVLKTQKSREIATQLGESAAGGLTMRLLENYQEARQTYNDVEEYAINQLSSMTEEERKVFLENNPKYKNYTNDEEIAKDIAKNSADVTFSTDWLNAAFDVMQMYGLRNIWSGALRGTSTANMRNLNSMAAKMFGNEGKAISEAVANRTLWAKTKQGVGNFLKDAATGVRAEWTEGIEEAINYISQQEGMYAGKKVFDADTPKSTLTDYMFDPHMWEQAFWGALGGVSFSVIGNKVGGLVQKALNKDWETAEKQHEAEILGRAARFNEYMAQVNLIKDGKNPFLTTEVDGKKVNPDIVGSADELLAIAEKEYIDNLVIDAANVGNLGLLKDFVQDSNIAKGLQEKLSISANDSVQMQQRMLERINATEVIYNDIINKVNELGGSFEVGKIVASKQVRANNLSNQYNQLINWAQNNINTEMSNPGNTITEEVLSNAELGIINYHINNLRTAIKNVQNDPTITKNRKKEMIAEYENQIDGLVQQYNFNTYTKENIDKFTADAFNVKNTNKELYNALYSKINAVRNKLTNDAEVNNSEQHLQQKINYLNNFFDKARIKIIDAAEKELKQMYNKYSIEEVDAVINGNEVNTITNTDKKIIKNAYTALDISSPGNAFLENRLTEFKRAITTEKRRQEEVGTEPVIDESSVDESSVEDVEETASEESVEEPVEKTENVVQDETINNMSKTNEVSIEDSANNTNNENLNIDDSSTGGQSEETSNTTPPVGDGGNNTPSDDSNTTPSINLPPEDDFIARGRIAMKIIDDYFASNNIDYNNNDEIISHTDGMIKLLTSLGFGIEESKMYVQNAVSDLTMTGLDLNFSSVSDVAVMARTATLGILTGNEQYFEQLIKDFVNSVDNTGNPRGRVINGITYVSIGQLAAFLTLSTNNKSTYNLLFEMMKDYLFSSTREKSNIRLMDEAELEIIRKNPRAFTSYVDDIIRERYNTLKDGIVNRVNVSSLNNNPDFKYFIKVKPGDELTVQYDHAKNRILLYHDNHMVGYLGVPTVNTKTGEYIMNNEGWNYTIGTKQGVVTSPFKQAMLDIFVNPNTVNEEFLSEIYNMIIKLAKTNNVITNELQTELIAMFDKLKTIYPDIVKTFGSSVISNDLKVNAMHHIIKIGAAGITGGYPQEESINNWFNRLYDSYAQATNIINGNFKGKITVGNINYGNLNNPEEGQEFNSIEDAVADYNEEVNQIGVAYGDEMIYSGETLGISTKATTGVSQMRIAKPDGTYMNANLQYLNLASREVSEEGHQIVKAAINQITDLIQKFINNELGYTFEHLTKDINNIITTNIAVKGSGQNHRNKASLFRGVGCDIKPNTYIIFKYDNKVLFTINAAKRTITTSNKSISALQHTVTNNGYDSYKKDAVMTDEFRKFLVDNLRESFRNVKFASSVSLINDKTRLNDDKTNKFVKRVNGKTIIDFGENNTWEFNSFQEMLVKTKSIKVNLKNNSGAGFAGNWKYNKDTTRLTVDYQIEVAELNPITEVTSDEVNNMFGNRPDDINDFKNTLSSEDLQISLTEFFKEDKNALDYINDLITLGVIPKNIKLQNGMIKNGKQANAKYNNKTDTIILNTKKLANNEYGRTIRIIVHESIHQKLNNRYDRMEAYKQILPIFKQFQQAVREGNILKLDANIGQYLFDIGLNEIDLKNKKHQEAIEEFFVESMTAKRLMDALNQIEDKTSVTETKKNLFTKLIEIIAKMFGIKINENSLLATAKNIYSNISEKGIIDGPSSTDSTAAPITTSSVSKTHDDSQLNIPFNVTEENNENISSKSNEELDINDAEYSSIDDIEVSNLYTLLDNVAYELRSDLIDMISTGQLSYACK